MDESTTVNSLQVAITNGSILINIMSGELCEGVEHTKVSNISHKHGINRHNEQRQSNCYAFTEPNFFFAWINIKIHIVCESVHVRMFLNVFVHTNNYKAAHADENIKKNCFVCRHITYVYIHRLHYFAICMFMRM